MKITPLEIRNHKVKTTYRGYHKEEMDLFLDLIATEVEQLTADSNDTKEKYRRIERDYETLKSREKELNQAILFAKNLHDDLKRNAEKDAEIIVSQAEIKADKIIEGANRRLAQLIDEIHDLRVQKTKLTEDLRHTLNTYSRILDIDGEDAVQEIEQEKIKYLKTYNDSHT